jgi:hypothetical protein
MDRKTYPEIGVEYSDQGVGELLGIPVASNEPVPDARDGEIVVYYGGWNLLQLRNSPAGQKSMRLRVDLYGAKPEPGYYRLLLPVPNTNDMTWHQQLSYLASINPAWQPASVVIAITAVLTHLTATGNDLLNGDFCRCAERTDNHRATLAIHGRVGIIGSLDDGHSECLWLAAAQKC